MSLNARNVAADNKKRKEHFDDMFSKRAKNTKVDRYEAISQPCVKIAEISPGLFREFIKIQCTA